MIAIAYIAWLIAAVYASIPLFWLMIHPFATRWRRRRGNVMGVVGLIWLAMILATLAVTWPWNAAFIYQNLWTLFPALIFIGGGLFIYRRTRSFGITRLIGQAELRPDEHQQQLVTFGIHGWVRHPIYLGHFCSLTGWTIAAGTKAVLALWVWGMVMGALMIRAEERELRERFGAQWREYAKRVPILFPRL